jgi:hypothetical protein
MIKQEIKIIRIFGKKYKLFGSVVVEDQIYQPDCKEPRVLDLKKRSSKWKLK